MRSAVGWNRLYSNGVAIRVMLEYIDYWGDQRVGDDGMTPLLNNREDEGSKQTGPILCYSVSPHFRPPFIPAWPSLSENHLDYPSPLPLIFTVSSLLPRCVTSLVSCIRKHF